MIHKRRTALEQSVKYFTGGLKPVSLRQPHPHQSRFIAMDSPLIARRWVRPQTL